MQAPNVNIPAGLYNTIGSEQGLGQYGTALLDPLASMTNWAANLASGGTAGNIPTTGSVMTQPGPTVTFPHDKNHGATWASSFDPNTGLITYTSVHNPSKAFTRSVNDPFNSQNFGNFFPESILNTWKSDYSAHQRHQAAGGGGKASLGPYLGSAWNAIQAQQGLPQDLAAMEGQTQALASQSTSEASQLFGQGETMLQQATHGTGLFPSQEAYVKQARQQGETEEAAMLAKLGLSSSTMAPQLKEQADLAAASTAGQLVQGNISAAQNTINLGQAAQKIALGAQTLEVGEKEAVFDMYSKIAAESVDFQKTLWEEAISGYGMLGDILSRSAQAHGYSLQGYQSVIDAEKANAASQVALDEASIKADSQSTSDMFGGLGKLLGAGGGIASLFGGGGGAAAGAAGGAAAGGSSILGWIGTALGAVASLFCWVAREVYGAENPRWLEFRAWMLTQSPDWLFEWYGRNGPAFAVAIRKRPVAKFIVRTIMNTILFFYGGPRSRYELYGA